MGGGIGGPDRLAVAFPGRYIPRDSWADRLPAAGELLRSAPMTIPAIVAILLFVGVLAALNRIEFGRFD